MKPELQRRVQRYGWDYSSPHYEKGWRNQLWFAQKRLLDAINFKEGETVLDISCGTGLVTFPLAETVGSSGQISGIDWSEKMIEHAREEATKRGLQNVNFGHMDAEQLDFAEASFDVAINSLGAMYYPDPDKAFREMYRVLKPGGRAGALVWGRRKECGWADIFPIVDQRVKSEVCPLFFQLGTGQTLLKAFEAAGFQNVILDRFSVKLSYPNDEEAIIGAFLGGAVALAYRKFDEQTKEEVHSEYIESIKPFYNGSAYQIPGEFVIAFGIK